AMSGANTSNQQSFRRLHYPSTELRPLHAFELTFPASWCAVDAPDAIVVLFPDGEGETTFRPNILVGGDRIPADADLVEIGRLAHADAAETFAEYALEYEQPITVSSQTGLLHLQSFRVPQVGNRL